MRSSNIYPQVRSWQYQIQLYKLSSFNKRRHFQKVSSCRSRPDFVEETIQVPIGANGSVALRLEFICALFAYSDNPTHFLIPAFSSLYSHLDTLGSVPM